MASAGSAPATLDNREAVVLAATLARVHVSARWFYWIAALSLVNSAVVIFGGQFHFVVGLGVTSVVVTHEMDSAFRIANRMVLLDRGKFIAAGTAEQMRESDNPVVHQFVNGLAEGPLTDRRRAGGYEDDLLGVE